MFRMFCRSLAVIAILAAIIIAANYAPLLSSHSDQDDCAFGPVSNQQYRAYLLEAMKRRQTRWRGFSRDDQQIGQQLRFRLSDMVADGATVYERIAIMHAILRAIGAEYLNTNGRTKADPFEGTRKRGQDVEFHYRVDINRLVFFQPYPRQVWIIATIQDPDIPRPEVTKLYGDRSISAAMVSIFDHPPLEFLTPSGQSCPPSPSPEAAARYQAKQN
jgi:hypothetical protein